MIYQLALAGCIDFSNGFKNIFTLKVLIKPYSVYNYSSFATTKKFSDLRMFLTINYKPLIARNETKTTNFSYFTF